jgi:Leucine-rich repeat (LRR) protein
VMVYLGGMAKSQQCQTSFRRPRWALGDFVSMITGNDKSVTVMRFRYKLRTFCILMVFACLFGVLLSKYRTVYKNNKDLTSIGAKIQFSDSEIMIFGFEMPALIQDSMRIPVDIEVKVPVTSERQTLLLLDQVKSIERLKLSLSTTVAESSSEIPRLPRLRELDLNFKDDFNLRFLKASPKLEKLDLYCEEGCNRLTLDTIPKLPALSYFSANLSDETTGDLAFLARLPSLSELVLWEVPSGESIKDMPTVVTLRKFHVECRTGTEENILCHLNSFPNLEELVVQQAAITREDIESLKSLTRLTGITFEQCTFDSDSFDSVPVLPLLHTLKISECNLPLNCLSRLERWDTLQNLSIKLYDPGTNEDKIGDKILLELPMLPELRSLVIESSWVTLTGLERLGRFPLLSELKLLILDFPPDAKINLPCFNFMRKLSLSGSCFDINGLRILGHFPCLRELDLSFTFGILDRSNWKNFYLDRLPLDELVVLDLSYTKITNETLHILPNLDRLEKLDLIFCRSLTSIPDEWATKAKRLQELNLNMVKLDSGTIAGISHLDSLQVLGLPGTSIALEDLPFVRTLRVVWIDSKKMQIGEGFPFPKLPEGLRIETPDRLFSDYEKRLLKRAYRNLTIVEGD